MHTIREGRRSKDTTALTRNIDKLWHAPQYLGAFKQMPHGKESTPFKGGPLPDNCPPKDAIKPPKDAIFLRLVPANPATLDHFKSSKAEGNRRQPRDCDDCRWAACSVWIATTPRGKLSDLAKLRNLSHMKFIAFIKVDESSGYIKPHEKEPKHLSFWMFEAFEVAKAIVKVEPL